MEDRASYRFVERARIAFQFLDAIGFTEIEALPTLLRYRKGEIEVDIYHGRKSYEVGVGVADGRARYPISAIVARVDHEIGKRHRNGTALTGERLSVELERLAALMKAYGTQLLEGDATAFSELELQRRSRAEEYSLDIEAEHVRPEAEAAFRRGDWASAAELYSRMMPRLTPSELGKLAVARKRRES